MQYVQGSKKKKILYPKKFDLNIALLEGTIVEISTVYTTFHQVV